MNTVVAQTSNSQRSPGMSGEEYIRRIDFHHWLGGGIRALHLARAIVMGLAIFVCTVSVVRAQTPLWDDNDYLISDNHTLVVLDENFHFKGDAPTCQTFCGSNFGILDWFANGDVILGLSNDLVFHAFRYNRQGEQIAHVHGNDEFFQLGTFDMKISFNDDIIVGSLDSVRRYIWDFPTPSFSSTASRAQKFPDFDHNTVFSGGVAVVRRADGSHELWVAGRRTFWACASSPSTPPARCSLTREFIRACLPHRVP